MTRSVIVTQEEDWFVAQDIHSGVASQGKSIGEAIDNLKEALELYYNGEPVVEDNPAKRVFLTTVEVAV